MSFDPKVYRNSKDGIGSPGDTAAVNSTDENTAVALLKGLYQLLGATGITVAGVSTAAKQDTGNATLTAIDGHVDGIETLIGTTNTALGTLATQTTVAAILAKIIAAPATEAKQDTGNTSLASIASLLATQAGYLDGIEALIGTTNGKDFATQTTLAAVLAKLNATIAATQSGTWTVQPGNTANTTAWKVDGSAVTQPTSLAAATNASTTAYATNLVVKASAGTLYGLSGYNSKTTAQFIQVHDAASLPADTAVPKITFLVQPSASFSLDFGARGRAFGAGIVICNSSTGPTKTIGSADIWADAQYA